MIEFKQYEAIRLHGNNAFSGFTTEDSESRPNEFLEQLNHINLIVGPNNAGKSRFLRAIFKSAELQNRSNNIDLKSINKKLLELDKVIKENMPEPVVGIGQLRRDTLEPYLNIKYIDKAGHSNLSSLSKVLQPISELNSTATIHVNYSYPYSLDRVIALIRNKALETLTAIATMTEELGDEPRCYIPILRGLRPITKDVDKYRERTEIDYDIHLDAKREIFTGQDFYKQLQEHMLGIKEQRQLIEEYIKFLSESFFEGQPIELVPRIGSDTVHLMFEGGEEMPIQLLGDGMQSLIILTFAPFIAPDRKLFLIEEPDLYLHPGMQRKLLEVFMRHERFKKHQFFMTSHSNHILDMTMDYPAISIFTAKRRKNIPAVLIKPVSYRDRNILHEIGARSSSIFLTNSTIWVEGITDRLYLRQYLAKFQLEHPELKKLSEDAHYSVVELGGGNLVHFKFDKVATDLDKRIGVMSMCSNSCVLIDGDNVDKGTRVADLEKQLGHDLFVLPFKEIENSLPQEVIIFVCNKLLNASKDSSFSSLSIDPTKLDNTKYRKLEIALGAHLDEILGKSFFASETGSIKQKMRFCEMAIEWMQDNPAAWEIETQMLDIVRQIYGFVEGANR